MIDHAIVNASEETISTTTPNDVTAEKDGRGKATPAGGHVRVQSGLKAGGEWGVGRRTPRA
ncbi:hypothetical protein LVJ94_07750 [Pendulispora rubella]|uniref:Uncharacterized protein n=1 Tax=Pendulispora rubella TaxID=2741070 RepID=A0ABZ2L8N8_9BACT